MAKQINSFWAKYKDPLWQKARLAVLSRDEWACQLCFDKTATLHVHHRYYLNGKDPWDYPLEAFVTLCETCHEFETLNLRDAKHDLLLCFSKKFMSNEILSIAHAVDTSVFVHQPDVVAAAMRMALENPEIQTRLVERYFEEITKQQREAESGS